MDRVGKSEQSMPHEYERPLDAIHGELLIVLDEIARPWARMLRWAANGIYRFHRRCLLVLISAAWWVAQTDMPEIKR
jgi:hypothetical protein